MYVFHHHGGEGCHDSHHAYSHQQPQLYVVLSNYARCELMTVSLKQQVFAAEADVNDVEEAPAILIPIINM